MAIDPPVERKPFKKDRGDSLTFARLRWLEDCAAVRGITATELRMGILLALKFAGMPKSRQRFEADGAPVVWPPQVQLAEELGFSRQNISAAARRLAKRGLLEVKPGQGRGHATEYTLIGKGKGASSLLADVKRKLGEPQKAKGSIIKGKGGQVEKANKPVAPFHSYQSTKSIHSQSQGEGDFVFRGKKKGKSHPAFEEIYRIWPNPDRNYDMALGCWINNAVKEQVDSAWVLKMAKRWCRHWAERETKRIPYLGYWLKNGMWEDDPPDLHSED